MKIALAEVSEVSVPRVVWMLREACWTELERELVAVDWAPLQRGTVDDSAIYFLEVLWNLLVKHIPRKSIVCKRSSHP